MSSNIFSSFVHQFLLTLVNPNPNSKMKIALQFAYPDQFHDYYLVPKIFYP